MGQDYTYVNNGNITFDDLNKNTAFKYDWGNLITELRHWLFAPGGGDSPEIWAYRTNYWYDEAGNRICSKGVPLGQEKLYMATELTNRAGNREH